MRYATQDDVLALVELGRPFVEQHPMLKGIAVSHESLATAISNIIEQGVVIVSEAPDGSLIGFLAGMIAPVWCAPDFKVAAELAWWMKPGHRNGMAAIRMLRQFENWAEGQNAAQVVVSSIPSISQKVGDLYDRMGYELIENSYRK
jgi:RimJ/RimL family protein N-acetyltransferase